MRTIPSTIFTIWHSVQGVLQKNLREKPAHQQETHGIPYAAFTQQSWLFLNAREGHHDMEDDQTK